MQTVLFQQNFGSRRKMRQYFWGSNKNFKNGVREKRKYLCIRWRKVVFRWDTGCTSDPWLQVDRRNDRSSVRSRDAVSRDCCSYMLQPIRGTTNTQMVQNAPRSSSSSLPCLALPSGWAGSYTCPALRPYQFGPMRVPKSNHRLQVTAIKP